MIRINLIAADRDRSKRPLFGSSSGSDGMQQKVTLVCGLLMLLTVLGIGLWYWSLQRQSHRIEADIVTRQQETERLRGLIQQVQAYEARKGQLQLRVSLIEELRKGREGPVHMLDEISRSIPPLLWLTEVKQQGAELTITGRCTSLTALSDFADNLKLSGYFTPVEILESQAESTPTGGGPAPNRFSIKATFVTPGT
jgi:type IV pilus assembly protein PilN